MQVIYSLDAATPQVLHGDIKTKNILLTSALQAKIGDVGLASLADKKSDDAKALKCEPDCRPFDFLLV